ncbi:hypothetical protein CLAFUW4_12831 [Fulvia fulva]|uniref:Uncharacterized protein n=1 Tax=Passalora fulva TaxID=5499 RepID=A0A9Q8PKD4_PASFU|nr:uncharacterized protein CLAFUR5_12697 [Fulvia fulva]KAK4612344.1 hypothetical protein CLAFUR4_12835 [Fulvia fulva]KAK4612555.1 hypothetical protein CLAFUR0_12841 [Fulvia fulva]UJO24022.1 hypothetical protein CLAFUR5_12697 [Fulvia fulva]WPV21675.1 hypothetical protein CLAFUW4_12831 [Fulvia fulva]WPV36390.1 hypothetical protein CLAFUW7_12839 [Fulvia fulva]
MAPPGLLDMPPEICNIIYGSYFARRDNHREYEADLCLARPPSADLTAVCSQIRSDTLKMYLKACERYWKEIRFFIDTRESQSMDAEEAALKALKTQPYFEAIQHLELHNGSVDGLDLTSIVYRMTTEPGIWTYSVDHLGPFHFSHTTHACVYHTEPLENRKAGYRPLTSYDSVDEARQTLADIDPKLRCTRYEEIVRFLQDSFVLPQFR